MILKSESKIGVILTLYFIIFKLFSIIIFITARNFQKVLPKATWRMSSYSDLPLPESRPFFFAIKPCESNGK